MELENMQMTIIVIMSIGLILGVGLFILGTFNNNVFVENISTGNNETFLVYDSETLSYIPTSLVAKVYNKTWVDCTENINLLYVELNQSKATVSLWFKNETTNWTSYIKSGDDVYINGTLTPGWDFSPYEVSGDFIFFCRNETGSWINISIDEIRVYEQSLNSTEVLEVYGYGR